LRPTEGICLTQAIKHRKGRSLDHVDVRATIGEQMEQPDSVQVERLNGIVRDRLHYLVRKTHAFAKDAATWGRIVLGIVALVLAVPIVTVLRLLAFGMGDPGKRIYCPVPLCLGQWTLRAIRPFASVVSLGWWSRL
jgi:hypothetical protein